MGRSGGAGAFGVIDFYTAATPNGWKVAIGLEELELAYQPIVLDLREGKQHQDWFLAMNPNARIPVIVDRGVDDTTVFESGAILIYLAEKTGQLLPASGPARFEVLQWLMFQMAGIGPMQGQAVVFERYFPEDVPAARRRYHNEVRRLYEVLDRRLSDREWLAGDYSIGDIANWSWLRSHRWARVDIEGLPHLARWMDAMAARPGCQRGVNVPPPTRTASQTQAGGRAITTT